MNRNEDEWQQEKIAAAISCFEDLKETVKDSVGNTYNVVKIRSTSATSASPST